MENLLSLIFFFFGLIIGSFLNVVICRYNAKSLGGRSACMSCSHELCWYELIPLFSFLGLRGRCRHCKSKISIQYPLVELVSGIIFLILFIKFSPVLLVSMPQFALTYVYYVAAFSLLLVISVYDIKHKIIPDMLALIFGVFSFIGVFLFSNYALLPHIPGLLELLSGPIIAAPFALLWLISGGRWMGFGDAKLAIGLGWLLGLTHALSGLVLAFWSGAIVGICMVIFSKQYGMKSEIPFAPYLVLGMTLAFIFQLSFFVVF